MLPWIEPIAGADENENEEDLFEVLDAYIDAPRPRREDPLDDESNNWISEAPYRCPADKAGFDEEHPDPAHRTYGTSYILPASDIYTGLEGIGAIDLSEDNPNVPQEKWKAQRAVSHTYELFSNQERKLGVILDFDQYHTMSNSEGRNALFWDGSADIYPGDPPQEFTEAFIAQVLKFCNFGV